MRRKALKLAKHREIIYNSCCVLLFKTEGKRKHMINFHNKKSKQIIAIIIILALVIAMVIPTISYFAR